MCSMHREQHANIISTVPTIKLVPYAPILPAISCEIGLVDGDRG